MSLPDNVRCNVAVPFPALVKGSGPITLAKQNGIWTAGFSLDPITSKIALAGDLTTDFLLVYDSVSLSFFKVSFLDIQTLRTLTVAQLPAPGGLNKGAGFMVSDATATAFWSIVAGGGANTVPVRSDGLNWRIG